MGLFKNMGRKFEEFKKTSEEVAAEGAEYECAECGKHLYTNHDDCPDCGGAVVVRTTEPDATEAETKSATEAEGKIDTVEKENDAEAVTDGEDDGSDATAEDETDSKPATQDGSESSQTTEE